MEEERSLLTNTDREDISPIKPSDGHKLKSTDEVRCACIPARNVLALLMLMGFVCAFAQRTVFNIALIAMVNFTQPQEIDNTSDYCPAPSLHENSTNIPEIGEFNWDATLQSILLGAFYYGYPISQMPFGYLAERFGGKYIFAFTGFTTGILSVMIPFAARWDPYALVVIRAIQGLCQGSIYPTCVAMWSRWAPPVERNAFYAFVNSGATLGTVVAMVITGLLCQSTSLGGWASSFYLFGGLSILWSFAWLFLAYDTPASHPRITAAERKYIEDATGSLDAVKYTTPPWRSIVTSIPIWGVFAVTCTDNFAFYVTFSCMPIFMKQVLHFDMSQNGLLTALPYIVQFPVIASVGWFADRIRKKALLRTVNIRRLGVIFGDLIPGIFLLIVGFVGCDKILAVSMLVLSLVFNSFTLVGPMPALFDLAPLYAGTLVGLLNGIGNVFGIIAPIAVAKITNNSGDQLLWRYVFIMSAVIYAFGTIIFCALISDKEQPWAKNRRSDGDNEQATQPAAMTS